MNQSSFQALMVDMLRDENSFPTSFSENPSTLHTDELRQESLSLLKVLEDLERDFARLDLPAMSDFV